MKVVVITRHAITNYGSLLQAIATQKVLEELGHRAEVIDYVRADERPAKLELTLLEQKPEWKSSVIKQAIYLGLRIPESVVVGMLFEQYRKKYLHLSKRYSSVEQLENMPPEADLYMTGSDQVWGPVADGELDRAYCLSFVDNRAKKISYASSFGHINFNEHLMTEFKSWLSDYRCITVREDSAVAALNVIGIQSRQVLDPTLLLPPEKWEHFMKPIPKRGYVLIYQLHNNPGLGEYARKVAEEKKLPLIRVSVAMHQINQEGKLIWAPEPGKFLSYIKNADCLITDSFHGTAFALLFHTPFVEVMPGNGTGTRNQSILSLTNLESRILQAPDDLTLVEQSIDFAEVDRVIGENRENSLRILQEMLNDCST